MTKKVLVADDDEDMLRLMELTLENDKRYQLHLVDGGQQVLDAVRKLRPDVVFLDVMMPDLDGFTVCRAIKENRDTANVKVVIVTALAQSIDRASAAEAGADDFVTKPFSPSALSAKLDGLLA